MLNFDAFDNKHDSILLEVWARLKRQEFASGSWTT